MPTLRGIKHATRILAAMLMVQTLGCVTKGDLAKVRQELAANMRTARQDVHSLRGTLESVQSKAQQEGTTTATFEARLKTLEREQEVISEEVVSQLGAMKKVIEDLMAKRVLEGETYRRELTDLNKRISDVQQDRAALTTNLQRVQVLGRALLRTYQLQVEGLRAHLKDIDQLAKELEPFADSGAKSR